MPIVRASVLLLCLLCAALAHATAQRTFVASTGADANTAFSCSIAKPCRGFAAAIGVTSAKGEVIVLDSAGYGAIPSITQSITITAPAGIYAGISVFAGDGITINAGVSDTVVLRGLTINGQGGANGIAISNAGTVHVENFVIANMSNIGITQHAGTLELKDTIVRNNANIGLYVNLAGQANLDHVRLEGNPYGIAAETGGLVAMQDSVVTGSSAIAVLACLCGLPTPTSVTISRSLISFSTYGIQVNGDNDLSAATIIISDSTITENVEGMAATGASGKLAQIDAARNTVSRNSDGLALSPGSSAIIDGNVFSENSGWDVITDTGTTIYTRANNTRLFGYNSHFLGSVQTLTGL